MNIHQNKQQHFNQSATALLKLIAFAKVVSPKKAETQTKRGSMSEVNISVQLSNVMAMTRWHGTSIAEIMGNDALTLDYQNGVQFHKLIDQIYNDRNVKNLVSRNFIANKTWKWLVKNKLSQRSEEPFSNHIISEMENSIKSVKIYFPILNLRWEIDAPFKIANVEFGYFTMEYFQKYINEINVENTASREHYHYFQKKYSGKVYVSYSIAAEQEKAKELALNACSIPMDILKICSHTLDSPSVKLDFDIDCRTNQNSQNEIIIENYSLMNGLTTSFVNAGEPLILDEHGFEYFKKRNLELFISFYEKLPEEISELQKLILLGISRLAKALSTSHYHRRIADLFSILESLLLITKDPRILETVSKYSSKLVRKTREERREMISLLSKMYEVRSQWVHHAKEERFSLDELCALQQIVHQLLIKLIDKSKIHNEKSTLLKEIDDAILDAY